MSHAFRISQSSIRSTEDMKQQQQRFQPCKVCLLFYILPDYRNHENPELATVFKAVIPIVAEILVNFDVGHPIIHSFTEYFAEKKSIDRRCKASDWMRTLNLVPTPESEAVLEPPLTPLLGHRTLWQQQAGYSQLNMKGATLSGRNQPQEHHRPTVNGRHFQTMMVTINHDDNGQWDTVYIMKEEGNEGDAPGPSKRQKPHGRLTLCSKPAPVRHWEYYMEHHRSAQQVQRAFPTPYTGFIASLHPVPILHADTGFHSKPRSPTHRELDAADCTMMQLDSRLGFERVEPPPLFGDFNSSRASPGSVPAHSCGAEPSGHCMPPSEQDIWSSRCCRRISVAESIGVMVPRVGATATMPPISALVHRIYCFALGALLMTFRPRYLPVLLRIVIMEVLHVQQVEEGRKNANKMTGWWNDSGSGQDGIRWCGIVDVGQGEHMVRVQSQEGILLPFGYPSFH
ncbi:hypothetical protein B0H10DRAFT_1968863 [Mycena sp. CBHHK59/15]|nr:hypothetical protein B0H10DRAFT_1968863 [Mycena sp. CBHHK59/15]